MHIEEMEILRVFVSGKPYAQTRPKSTIRYGRIFVYSDTSKTLKEWKQKLRAGIKCALRSKKVSAIEGAVFCDMIFSLPVKDKKKHWDLCYTKPDKDNLEKAVLDVMEEAGVFETGDSQVAVGQVTKVYVPYGEEGVLIRVGKARAKRAALR